MSTTSAKRIVSTTEAPAAIGAYSQAVVAAGLVHCSGQIALDPATGELIDGGVQEQCARALDNLRAVLEAAGSSMERVVKCNVYLTDLSDFAIVNEVYGSYFEAEQAPARACVEVSRLPKDVQVEIDCVALAGD
ncbi:MAG: 2-iminobutanoate/2-iminopropanoate deaminase [Planctomycetota bacterium]|jgi:2-iminobutanoate/2-iminopropanoate deaminase